MTTSDHPAPEDPVPENPARWAPDPLGRHQYRYWDGTQWTEHVSDDGRITTDAPIANPAPAIEDDAPTTAAGFGATHLGAPVPGSGAAHLGAPVPGSGAAASSATWTQPAANYDVTAVLGRRYGAFLIDAAVSLIVFGVLFFATATTHTRAEMLREPGCHLSANDSAQVECNNRAVVTVNDTVYEAEGGMYLLLCVLFTLLYFALMEGLTGATAGKHITGLRVVTPEGTGIGLPRALVRWAVFAVDGPLTLFICGIITSSVSAGHRRLGDMAANSYVIAKGDASRPVSVRPR
ncbi:MAG TPA: RDD family protein [Acidimicrobiia bacterium]|nr:RDD family protein [Acidimicrobiia bacterium]